MQAGQVMAAVLGSVWAVLVCFRKSVHASRFVCSPMSWPAQPALLVSGRGRRGH